ncbi:hypothetical protein N8772_00810 [Rickettsiales bacterium]|nr:hypothetical protein [Rickettsiales bacterium]MDB2550445.1 hypothetical protein [Rickettsiales bacterium]
MTKPRESYNTQGVTKVLTTQQQRDRAFAAEAAAAGAGAVALGVCTATTWAAGSATFAAGLSLSSSVVIVVAVVGAVAGSKIYDGSPEGLLDQASEYVSGISHGVRNMGDLPGFSRVTQSYLEGVPSAKNIAVEGVKYLLGSCLGGREGGKC